MGIGASSPLSNGLRRGHFLLLIAMPAAPMLHPKPSGVVFVFPGGVKARMICWMVWSGLREGNGRGRMDVGRLVSTSFHGNVNTYHEHFAKDDRSTSSREREIDHHLSRRRV